MRYGFLDKIPHLTIIKGINCVGFLAWYSLITGAHTIRRRIMTDEDRTRESLLAEVYALRQRVADLEAARMTATQHLEGRLYDLGVFHLS